MVFPYPLWPHKAKQSEKPTFCMLNYTYFIGTLDRKSPNLRLHGRHENVNQTLLSDSGGFQLLTGRLDYINPLELVEWYGRNVDIGMVLDPPMGGLYWPKGHIEQAEAQAKCTDVMIKAKPDRLELMNILHGRNSNQLQDYANIVSRPDLTRIGLGGAYFQTIAKSVNVTLRTLLSDSMPKPEHWHLFGLSGAKVIYPLMRMAGKKLAKQLTSDGTTYDYQARMKKMFSWPTIDSTPTYIKIGLEQNIANNFKKLACGCPVCSAVKYLDILALMDCGCVTTSLSLHNMYSYVDFTKTMNDIMKEASLRDIQSLLAAQFPSKRYDWSKELSASLGLVDHVAKNGLDALDKYKSIRFYLSKKQVSSDNGTDITRSPHTKETYILPSLDTISMEQNGEELEANINDLELPSYYDSDGDDLNAYWVEDSHPEKLRVQNIYKWMREGTEKWQEMSQELAKPKTEKKEVITNMVNAGGIRTRKPGKVLKKTGEINKKVRSKRGVTITEKMVAVDSERRAIKEGRTTVKDKKERKKVKSTKHARGRVANPSKTPAKKNTS